MKRSRIAWVAVLLGWAVVAPAGATLVRQVSGHHGGVEWTARSTVVGTAPTGGATGGDPIYWPSFDAPFSPSTGVVGLFMNDDPSAPASGYFCSGTLLSDRRSILTAAHCVSDGFGTRNPASTTVYFQPPDGLEPTQRIGSSASAAAAAVSRYFVHPSYTGQVVDHNDIAVLRLADTAPTWATSHEIHTGAGLTGVDFEVFGYGRLSSIGGAAGTPGIDGANTAPGRLRSGDNRYEFRLGDADFGGYWNGVFGSADASFSYLADFDSGLGFNDAGCRFAGSLGLAGGKYCDLGRGPREAAIAGGDSGGPSFVGGQVAGISSYALTLGPTYGDAVPGLQSSFGEFSGYVPTYLHADFIHAAMLPVPEPRSAALMLAGLGLVGVAARRRRPCARPAAAT